jgi:dTDP-4-amino-4,6-dideoxygalactose transaminase
MLDMKYKVPFVNVPLHFSTHREELLGAFNQVLSRGNLILRDEVRQFERQFAEFLGAKYAVGVNSGTDAMHFALRGSGLRAGDEVITVSHGCIATLAGIVHAGGVPVLVDVGDDYNIDVGKIEAAVGPKTRFIVPVHLNGRACDMKAIADIAQRHGLVLVEDCAQALGARFDHRAVGTFGKASAFSLYPFKVLGAFGDAGIVVTDDPAVAAFVRVLRDYGQDRETGEILCYGYNSKLDNLQAAFLTLKMRYLPAAIERRRHIADLYRRRLSTLPQLRLPHYDNPDHMDVFLNYAVRVRNRDGLVAYLKQKGIEPLTPLSLIHPLHHHSKLNLTRFSLPNTDLIAREFFYLPTTPELTDDQVIYVAGTIADYFNR